MIVLGFIGLALLTAALIAAVIKISIRLAEEHERRELLPLTHSLDALAQEIAWDREVSRRQEEAARRALRPYTGHVDVHPRRSA